ncbi:MAG TPA: hypothetical protein VNE38_12880 [Ktedonobacteraceae bacterium]|nr:hypothetical protein [Ktedonobacteraceae bacterium]
MSQEQNAGTSPEQQSKPATSKRNNRSGRNRPVLVTGAASDQQSDVSTQDDSLNRASTQTTVPTLTEEAPVAKSRPSFFSTLGGRKEETADAAAARLARATRNKAAVPGKKEVKEVREIKKSEPKSAAKGAPARSGAAPAKKGGFKPRHLIGILLYLVVADVVGVYEKTWLVNAHLEKLLFNLGPLSIYASTVAFLLTLVILLVLLARFDLVPRSLTSALRQPATTNRNSSRNDSDDDSGNGRNAPNVKQGVKGANDDLYQEYRETQRYWQRRDRKK